MNVTAHEAKTKRCHEGFAARLTSEDGDDIYTRMGMTAAPKFCLGSACMAWRWRGWRNTGNPTLWFTLEEDAASYQTIHGAVAERIGYCGKAGKP